jgi:L-iditol 2-dehydrogenase
VTLGLTKLAPGTGHVALSERPARAPAAGEVALAVRGVGICGTDLHIVAGEYPSVPPVTMGHEVSGVVAEVGEDVDSGWVGARVVSETYFSTCGRCEYCRDGRRNLCLERRSIGTHVDGAFASRLIVPAANLHRIPDWLDEHAATLAEPLACVCNCLLDPPVVGAGDRVLVIGPGAVGLLAAQVARANGGRVTVRGIERDRARLALARELGLDTGDSSASPDVVVECSGSEGGVRDGLTALRRGGRFVQIGLRGADITAPFDTICFHELTVTSGFASTAASWRQAMRLIEDRRVDLPPLISEVAPLTEWERLFDASRAGLGVKFVLAP